MQIGPIAVQSLCRLAPMAGISNTPFRLVCKELGSSLTTSEEISAAGLIHNHRRTFEIAGYLPAEQPIAMQLVGGDPAQLAAAARILEDKGADIVDLNMGCPVTKVVKTGAGAALMRDPAKCATIFRAMRKAVQIPLTIKVRGGWDIHTVNAPEIARIAEAEGIDAIAVHPRTRSQQYSGFAPWEIIRMVVEAVDIPVTGNGDVRSFSDARRMQAETGCASVMIGRGALGRPWVFDPEFDRLSQAEQDRYKYRVIRRHFSLIETYMNERFALVQMKKHLAWYTGGMHGAAQARQQIFSLKSKAAVLQFLDDYWARSSSVSPMEAPANASANASRPESSP